MGPFHPPVCPPSAGSASRARVTSHACAMRSGSIEKEIGKLAGVASVSADPKSKDVQIEFNDPCTWDEIKRTLVANEFPPEGEEIVS